VSANYLVDSVSVLLNNGNGTFGPSVDYEGGRLPAEVAIGDLNGDGKPDVATANSDDSGTMSVLLGLGDGSLGAEREYRAGSGLLSVALGDLNGDGKLDAVTANAEGNSVSVLLNSTGMCNVPALRGRTLPVAKKALGSAGCRFGRVSYRYSKTARGRVSSQKPGAGSVLPSGGRVDVVVSLGRKR
jgi:hypothetical protein